MSAEARPVLATAAPSAHDTSAPIAISVRDISKRYRFERPPNSSPHGGLLAPFRRWWTPSAGAAAAPNHFWALDGVSFDVMAGERVGVIGRNGAGKSTLLKILSRIVAPTRGEARIRGRVSSLLEVGVGFDNKLTGRENVFVNASLHGLSRAETAERYEQIVEFAGLDSRFLDMRVKHYSSGMRVRLAFSVAAHLDPDILILDEVLAVGDAAFQEKCLERVDGMMKHRRTLLFVSHSMSSVMRFCSRAIWLDAGKIVMDGAARETAAAYLEKSVNAGSTRAWTRAADDATSLSPDAELPAPEFGVDGVVKEPPAAELVSVSLIGPDRQPIESITVDQKFGIEFVYDVLAPGKVILPSAKFFNDEEVQMFSVAYTEAVHMREPKRCGRYHSIVWIPPHLFNVGRVHVGANLTTPTAGPLIRHTVIERALSFQIYEAPFGTLSARGPYKELKGVVRPMMEWETSAESTP